MYFCNSNIWLASSFKVLLFVLLVDGTSTLASSSLMSFSSKTSNVDELKPW